MRISDCAELTGTTVRTIRYYHQIGLLPVPEQHLGRRDYELDHVGRILRIRWLADAGIPLETIRDMLDDEPDASAYSPDPHERRRARSLHELTATADTLDQRIAALTQQRERVQALITMASEGRGFTPLPDAFSRFYDRVAARLEDPDALEALRKEQRLGEMFAQRRMLTHIDALTAIFDRLNDHDINRVVEFYTVYVQIPRVDETTAKQLVAQLHSLIVQWKTENPELTNDTVALLPPWSTTSPGRRIFQGFFTLVTDDRNQAQLLRNILDTIFNDHPHPTLNKGKTS